jgi:hypothetical protein
VRRARKDARTYRVDCQNSELRQSPNNLLLILEPLNGTFATGRVAVRACVALGKKARWYTTMLGPGPRCPAVFKLNKPPNKSSLQRFGRIVASVVCHHRQSFLQADKDHHQRARGPNDTFTCCYITILANSALFFSLRRDKVLSSALESFLEDLTHKLSPFPRVFRLSLSILKQSFKTSPWKASNIMHISNCKLHQIRETRNR